MTIIEFKEFLRDIGIYYERKAPGDGTTDAWYERIKKIPHEPLGWITDKIYDQSETYPRNIPNIMWAFYREWIQANPNKIALQNFFHCPDCDSEGVLYLTKTVNGHDYRYVARCRRCQQSSLRGLPEMTKGEAIAQGYTPTEQPKAGPIPTNATGEVNAIIYRLAHKSKMERAEV
jgi:hypothetical protein